MQNFVWTYVTGVFIPKVCGDGAALRAELLNDFGIEIGTSFGPLDGKIWRIGTMGYSCRKANVMRCLSALEMTLHRQGYKQSRALVSMLRILFTMRTRHLSLHDINKKAAKII